VLFALSGLRLVLFFHLSSVTHFPAYTDLYGNCSITYCKCADVPLRQCSLSHCHIAKLTGEHCSGATKVGEQTLTSPPPFRLPCNRPDEFKWQRLNSKISTEAVTGAANIVLPALFPLCNVLLCSTLFSEFWDLSALLVPTDFQPASLCFLHLSHALVLEYLRLKLCKIASVEVEVEW